MLCALMHSTKDICRLKCDTMTIMIYNFYVRETNGKKITNLHIALQLKMQLAFTLVTIERLDDVKTRSSLLTLDTPPHTIVQ